MGIAIAAAGVIDPAFTIRQAAPLTVAVRAGSPAAEPETGRVGRQLADALGDTIRVSSNDPPTDVILVGRPESHTRIPTGVRVSTVSVSGAPSPNVWVADAAAPRRIASGQAATVVADVRARGMSGKTSVIVLEQEWVEVARVEHRWSADEERFSAAFIYAPPATGLVAMRVAAQPFNGEATTADNAASVGVTVDGRPLRVFAHESRPSWAAAFVRRALESDPAFAVAASVRPSRNVDVTAGGAVPLRPDSLNRFDAVIVGAPEELTAAHVDALESFVRVRGGVLVFVPDRLPSGAAARLLPPRGFDEVLLDRAISLDVKGSGRLRASELALPREPGPGATPLATVPPRERTAIVWWPLGAGRILFSGALDAWRYRAADADGFETFWRTTVAAAAISAPAPVSVTIEPPVVRTGTRARVRVGLRRPEYDDRAAAVTIPAARAELIAPDGSSEIVRLWPSSEPGVYETDVDATRAGRHSVRVSAAGSSAEAVFLASDDEARGSPDDRDVLAAIAAATGGRTADLTELSPIVGLLRNAQRPRLAAQVYPLRSSWWILPLAGALCLEWALRRRRGLR